MQPALRPFWPDRRRITWPEPSGPHVPLGQVADIRVITGPPMIRDEGGMLTGYVYVDIDPAKQDIGSYVADARAEVARSVHLPSGYALQWTGQYELLQQMQQRMRVLVPLTLAVVLLQYNLSTAVWVGLIALAGLATQMGVVMVVYCDSAYHRHKREGRIRTLDDIVEATLEGSV